MAARAGSGRAAGLFGRYGGLLASAHHDLRRDARVLERADSTGFSLQRTYVEHAMVQWCEMISDGCNGWRGSEGS